MNNSSVNQKTIGMNFDMQMVNMDPESKLLGCFVLMLVSLLPEWENK